MNREKQLEKVQQEAKKLFVKKNKDYGDSFATYGTIGVLVRMGDKIKRLQTITSNSVTFVNDENIRDTLMDLHNYSAMAIMLLDEGKDTPNKSPLPRERTERVWDLDAFNETLELGSYFDAKNPSEGSLDRFSESDSLSVVLEENDVEVEHEK